jgi:hypothetical protein
VVVHEYEPEIINDENAEPPNFTGQQPPQNKIKKTLLYSKAEEDGWFLHYFMH